MSCCPVRKSVVTVASLIALAACGGGGGTLNVGGGGIGGTGISTGTITSFGSVFVNGVEYDTTMAAFRMEGLPSAESDLRVGMVVKVYGSRSGTTGKATLVEYNDNLEGLVQTVDAANNRLVVMGQIVVVDSLTVFDGAALSTLSQNNIVEVSGWVDNTGAIHATRIELKKSTFTPGADELELKGAVANLDTLTRTFTLGGLTVYYGGLGSGLQNGQYVEVKSTAGLNLSGQFIASSIETNDNSLGAAIGDHVELEGLVTRFQSSANFSINGQKVSASTTTQFENGTAADLTIGARLEVEGVLNIDGLLEADKVSFRQTGKVELQGNVQAKDVTAGTVTLLGVTVKVNNLTEMRDQSADTVRRFSLADITVGDQVEIVAYPSGADLIASRLEREDATSETNLQGPIDTVTSPQFTVLGITVVTNGTTHFEPVDFFAQATSGQVVHVEGILSGSTLTATHVELEH